MSKFTDQEARLGKRQRMKRSHLKRFSAARINVGSGGLSSIIKMRDVNGSLSGEALLWDQTLRQKYFFFSKDRTECLAKAKAFAGTIDPPLSVVLEDGPTHTFRYHFGTYRWEEKEEAWFQGRKIVRTKLCTNTIYFVSFHDKMRNTIQRSCNYGSKADAISAYRGDYVSWNRDVFALNTSPSA